MERNDVQRLLDLEQIRQLKARYCRFIDTKQWQLLRTLFTDGARFEGFRAGSRTRYQSITVIPRRSYSPIPAPRVASGQ